MKEILKRTILVLMVVLSIIFSAGSVFAEPDADSGEAVPTPIVADANNAVPAAVQTEAQTESGGMSAGGVVLIMFVAVIINAVISFIISNRFYKMSRRDSHLQAELRALRRDIDEKFSGNIKQINERAVSVKNNNKDYSRGTGIEYKEETSEAISEIAKKWNIKIEEEKEPELKTSVKTAPQRSEYMRGRENAEDKTRSKARKFLGDIFPFDED